MKRNIVIYTLLVLFFLPLNAFAGNEYKFWKKRRVLHIGYVTEKMESDFGSKMTADQAFVLDLGRVIYLHKNPIADRLKFGLDLICSINYAKYAEEKDDLSGFTGTSGFLGEPTTIPAPSEEDEFLDFGNHKLDVGMKVGPSLTYNPVGKLRLAAYFHVTPSMSAFINDGQFNMCFVPFFDYGLEVSYRCIGVGVEKRQGVGKYEDCMSKFDTESNVESLKSQYLTNSIKFYLTFRF